MPRVQPEGPGPSSSIGDSKAAKKRFNMLIPCVLEVVNVADALSGVQTSGVRCRHPGRTGYVGASEPHGNGLAEPSTYPVISRHAGCIRDGATGLCMR